MSNISSKPKMTSIQLVQKMRDEKGIKFTLVSEQNAEQYLTDVNNYLRTAAYRKNYQKYQNGKNIGKYINLDFAYLKELSAIDFHFRNIIIKMCIDIEHDLKVKILKEIENDISNDGYTIAASFLSNNPNVIEKIGRSINSPFTGDLINKYFTVCSGINPGNGRNVASITNYSDCPIWVLFELLTFGDLIIFFDFYRTHYSTNIQLSKSVLNLVKSLRNACAHNNCVIACLNHRASGAPSEITQRVSLISEISQNQRQKKLSQRPMLEFVAVLYAFDLLVSTNVKTQRIKELNSLVFERMYRNKEYFADNDLISSSYGFVCKVVSDFF